MWKAILGSGYEGGELTDAKRNEKSNWAILGGKWEIISDLAENDRVINNPGSAASLRLPSTYVICKDIPLKCNQAQP